MASLERNSYFKVYRSVFECELLQGEPFDKFHAWIWMIAQARYKPEEIVIKGEKILLQRGEFFTRECDLIELFGWSRGKVRRTLKLLENEQMITLKRTRYGTVISVEKYGFYQSPRTSDGTSDDTSDGTSDGTSFYYMKESKRKINKPQERARAREGGAAAEWRRRSD